MLSPAAVILLCSFISTGEWEHFTPMGTARSYSAAVVQDGALYAIRGRNGDAISAFRNSLSFSLGVTFILGFSPTTATFTGCDGQGTLTSDAAPEDLAKIAAFAGCRENLAAGVLTEAQAKLRMPPVVHAYLLRFAVGGGLSEATLASAADIATCTACEGAQRSARVRTSLQRR